MKSIKWAMIAVSLIGSLGYQVQVRAGESARYESKEIQVAIQGQMFSASKSSLDGFKRDKAKPRSKGGKQIGEANMYEDDMEPVDNMQ